MTKNSVRTSKTVASKESKALSSGKTSKTTKTIAASALSNRRSKCPDSRLVLPHGAVFLSPPQSTPAENSYS